MSDEKERRKKAYAELIGTKVTIHRGMKAETVPFVCSDHACVFEKKMLIRPCKSCKESYYQTHQLVWCDGCHFAEGGWDAQRDCCGICSFKRRGLKPDEFIFRPGE